MTSLVLMVLSPAVVQGQQVAVPELEILGAEFDHLTGTLDLQLRAGGTRSQAIEGLTVLVDGVPRAVVPADSEGDTPRQVLLAIDVSGSMRGAPIEAASRAAASLIGKLADGDSVGVLTFSDTTTVLVAPTTDHSSASRVLSGLVAFGDTALYDAALLSIEVVQSAGVERPAVVLLSDGEESGASSAAESDVLEAVAASGVEIFTFALGATADSEFLRLVADASGGSAYEVPDESSLSALFESLGGRLGATLNISARAPGLSATHTVEVRGRIDKQVVIASLTFEVPPAQLVIGLPGDTAPGDPVELTLEGVPADALLVATLDGAPSTGITLAAGRVLLDPWEIDPGTRMLRIEARQSGAVVAQGARALNIAELAPLIDVEPVAERARSFTASVRSQGSATAVLVAMVDGAEVGRSLDGTLSVTLADDAVTLSFLALSRDGTTLTSEAVAVPEAAAEGSAAIPVLVVLSLLILIASAWWVFRRRRGNSAAQPVFRPTPTRVAAVRPRPDPEPGGSRPTAASPAARLVFDNERGDTHVIAIGPRPLTVGCAPSCDVVLDGSGVRPEHARLSLTRLGALNIHGLGSKSVRPYENDLIDQWLTLQPGEEIRIGQWSLSLRLDSSASQEEAS